MLSWKCRLVSSCQLATSGGSARPAIIKVEVNFYQKTIIVIVEDEKNNKIKRSEIVVFVPTQSQNINHVASVPMLTAMWWSASCSNFVQAGFIQYC
jgi:hypothetical protein